MDTASSIHHAILPRASSGSSTSSSNNSASLSQLIATLVPVLLVAAIYTGLFFCLRPRLKRNYSPRSHVVSLRSQERSPDLPNGMFNWIGTFNKIPDTYVLNHHSLDGYLLLRYLKISVAICFVGCCMTWPVLFPVNATGGGGQKQLNLISFSNVTNNKNRFYAHTFIAWIFFSFVFYVVARESIYYINLRQAYLLSPLYANRMSSRTVLFTSVPKDYLNEGKLRRMFGKQVKNLWIANECDEIENLVEQRDKTAMKLEAAETKLVKMSNNARLAEAKKGTHHEEGAELTNTAVDGESGSVAARWVQPKNRPTHRLGFLGLIGQKVDSINWCRSELERLIPMIDAKQASYRAGEATFICSVFVEFYTQAEAQAAYQSLAHHQALHMSPRFIGINPEDIIWSSLKINWASRVVRNIVTSTFVFLLIIFWAIPVAFVGVLSNISALTQGTPATATSPAKGALLPWLSFINKIPPTILGVVQGLLPSVLLAVLMALLPIILRKMAKLAGKPSASSVELRVQNTYFVFQVVQVFLVTTITSSATAAVSQIIRDPSSVTSLLGQDLPKASNFYISYFILQGLAISSGAVLQLVGVILYKILGKFLDSTPRKMYKRFATLSGLGWGTVFPVYTLLTVIAITYSIIAPLVLGFATIGLYLIYLAYRYNMLYVFNATIDTQGLVYPRALQQTTTGVYLSVVCLIGLFAIKTAIGPLILMIVYLIFLALFHFSLNSAIDPLLMYLPKSLQAEEESLLSIEDGNTNGDSAGDKKGLQATATATAHARVVSNTSIDGNGKDMPPAPHKKPSFITKFLYPHVYTDYQTLRRLVPKGFAEIEYAPEVERDAYYHPAISSPTPILWIPKDEMGVSRQEVRHSSKVIPITDEGAGFDDKGKMVWDQENEKPPVYQEKIYY